jgi:TPR repeat protein
MAPDAFVCSITRAVMERPVVCADGHSYEEDAIRRWLACSARSPMTNAPLQSTALVPNIALRHAIAEWRTDSEGKESVPLEDAEAHFWTGWECHASGDRAAAARWYARAAAGGNEKAQFWLGCMYYDGEGVAKDPAAAARWFTRAAEDKDKRKGNADAQLLLGYMYRTGAGVTKDDEAAAAWYRKAADQGDADAQFWTGRMLKDDEAAAAWYRKAADQGHADAQYAMGAVYHHGNTIARFAVAERWYQKAADQGHADAQHALGCMRWLAPDAAAAVGWFRKAADQGHADAQYRLGVAYDACEGDHHAAAAWYRKAADQGHSGARRQLDAM